MLLLTVLLLLLGAIPLSLVADRIPERVRGLYLMAPAAVAFFILAIPLGGELLAGREVAFRVPWVPQLDLDFSLWLNGLGFVMALLVTGIGSLILLYASGYMHGHPQAVRLYASLYAFMLSMVGVVISDHLLLLFVFWELTSITSYILIGFNHEDGVSRRNSLQALIITGLGGMALLAGFILIETATGVWHISELYAMEGGLAGHALYPGIFVLVLLGAFTKSAQFPFHFWLPNAMAAPTPVSAYLHSATMVKAGVFLLALMAPVLGGTTAWTVCLVVFGGITLLVGGVFGMRQFDLKAMLAGTTLAVLGLLTLLIGLDTAAASLAFLLFLIAHALYKATLFMVAGAVDHETGTRDVRLLAALRKTMPWTTAAVTLAAVSKMGLPPLLGFLAKEYTYKASLYGTYGWLVTLILFLGNALLITLAARAGVLPFWRTSGGGELPKHPHEAPWSMRAGPLLLAGLSIFMGIAHPLFAPLIATAHATIAPGYPPPEIKLWAGINLPLILSVVTVLLGLALLRFQDGFRTAVAWLRLPRADDVYDVSLQGVVTTANWQTRFLQSGYLRNYLLIILGATALLVSSKLWRFSSFTPEAQSGSFSLPVFLMSFAMLYAVWLAVRATTRLTALIALGVIGFGVALIFAAFSAPDLAITQVLVETLTIALFAWVVYKLPAIRVFSSTRTVLVDAAFSAVIGVMVMLLVLKSRALEFAPRISDRLAEWSYPEAHGANVVNVILVDFRALDTFGEIIVLGIAAVGAYVLLKRPASSTTEEES